MQHLEDSQRWMRISDATRKELANLLDAERAKSTDQGGSVNQLKRQFESVCKAIQELLDSIISNHIAFENTLHEICIYLTSVQGSSEYILDAVQIPSWERNTGRVVRVTENAATISSAASLGLSTGHNLLRYYTLKRSDADSLGEILNPKSEPIDLDEELERVRMLWQGIAKSRRVDLDVEYSGDLVVVGDRIMLRQCLNNLLSNGIKYSFKGDQNTRRFVKVSASVFDPGFRESRVRIRFSNYGLGLSEREKRRVGTLGFRGEAARREHPIGFGIGLYVVEELVSAMGGIMRFNSKYLHDSKRTTRSGSVVTAVHKIDVELILPTERK